MIGLLIFLVLFIGFIGLAVFWWILQSRPPKYNGLLWKVAGGVDTIQRKPEGQKPYSFNYRWYDLFPRWRPIYMWKEEQVEEEAGPGIVTSRKNIIHWEPDKPADYRLVQYPNGDVKDYVTPYELYDNTDWGCARRFEAVKSKAMEAVKLGVSIAMVAICAIGIIMLIDMLGKEDKTAPVGNQTPAKISMIMGERNYGIW